LSFCSTGQHEYSDVMDRRNILKSGIFGSAACLAATTSYAREKTLRRLPQDFEGPFYPRGNRNADTPDLLRNMKNPHGDILHLAGRVLDEYGDPVSDAVIDIWQTDPDSRYKHPNDRSRGDRYDDFAYWGKSVTDAEGQYSFRTYVPGAYRPRPSHIHYKIWRDGNPVLTSQIYFQERGGTRGRSRFENLSSRQVTSLKPRKPGEYDCEFQIVV